MQLGVKVLSPRDTFKEALNIGLILNGNAWTEAHRNRNLTTHTYDEKLADQVYHYIITDGLIIFKQLAKETDSWQIKN